MRYCKQRPPHMPEPPVRESAWYFATTPGSWIKLPVVPCPLPCSGGRRTPPPATSPPGVLLHRPSLTRLSLVSRCEPTSSPEAAPPSLWAPIQTLGFRTPCSFNRRRQQRPSFPAGGTRGMPALLFSQSPLQGNLVIPMESLPLLYYLLAHSLWMCKDRDRGFGVSMRLCASAVFGLHDGEFDYRRYSLALV